MPDPPAVLWSRLGVVPLSEFEAGHQSRTFLADGPDGRLVVKVTAWQPIESDLDRRLRLVDELAAIDRAVVGPVERHGALATRVGAWRAVAYPYISGPSPDSRHEPDVAAMGRTLARLHHSFRLLAASRPDIVAGLGPVAALQDRSRAGRDALAPPRRQAIHGDFAASNLIATEAGLRVIDFDEAGIGPVAFDVGNSLYLDRFDSWRRGDLAGHERFRSWFVDAYRSESAGHQDRMGPPGNQLDDATLDDAALDEAVQTRVEALERWLDEPDEAPTGIRTAPADWHRQLRRFIADTRR